MNKDARNYWRAALGRLVLQNFAGGVLSNRFAPETVKKCIETLLSFGGGKVQHFPHT
jgi:hypothetical protein